MPSTACTSVRDVITMLKAALEEYASELRDTRPRAVVVGGSAGAIQSLSELLGELPASFPLPIIVVLHVGRDAKGTWATVFHTCRLRVVEAEDKDEASAGTVYVAPPDYHLLVGAEGRLQLSLDANVNFARPSIDVLFESAAWTYGARLLGIVLSGANSDGALGLAAIARAGGACWVQKPESAATPSMPRSALGAVPGARSLGLAEMAALLGCLVV
jgi:two-component system chemotaxis response regulator CheB